MSVASSSGCSSLVGYENNNEINRGKMKKQSANSDGSSNGTSATVSSNGVSTTKTHRRRSQSQRGGRCGRSHLNCLWSVWYGLCGTLLQAYISIKCARRFLQCATLAWPETEPPLTELHAGLLLTTLAVLLLPLFLVSAVFKVGNNANDGVKLGRGISTCSRDPASPLLGAGGPGGGGGLWRHGGPTAPFLHIVTALCLLLPKLLMEARLIEAGFLPQEAIWKTDLDFMVVHRDRLVVLSFMTGPVSNFSTIGSSLPLMTSPSPLDTTTYIPPLASTNNITTTGPKSQPFSMVHTLKDILGSDNIDSDAVPDAGWGTSVSVEYLNYALALFVYSIRYPAVFWNTNKCFGSLFSLQLLVNSAQCLLSYAGMSVLYKVQIVGPGKALPLLRHRGVGLDSVASFSAILGSNRQSPFLLNSNVTIGLFVLSGFLVLSSSLVLYLYGYGRFRAFVNAERARKVIALRDSNISGWGYFTHCAALCSLLSVAVVSAPLLHDYTVVYRGSLDGAILACIVAAILHLFLWIVLWLFLTIKQKWIFKLRVTVGRATVRSARSVKLVTDVDLITSHAGKDDLSSQPLLVVGNGRTYTIQDTSPKKTIMSVIQKTILDQKASSGQDDNEAEEQIYWLRPAVTSPKHSSDKGPEKCGWFNKRLGSTGSKHKVTFNDIPSTSSSRHKTGLVKNRARSGGGIDEDDGDYATLRELPLIPTLVDPGDDSTSEEGKLNGTGSTPRCLRRADSGVPHEELTPRSDSISTESSTSPPEAVGSNHSESSSGIHSNASSDRVKSLQIINKVTTSVTDLAQIHDDQIHQWTESQHKNSTISPQHFSPNSGKQPIYGFSGIHSPQYVSNTNTLVNDISDHGIPAVVLENSMESTVVIRRKQIRSKLNDVSQTPVIEEEPYGRSTNMRLTSFTEHGDALKNTQASSATLPHYPTQPVPTSTAYPHCSTMPLPQHNNSNVVMGSGTSCNAFPRQHTTIPTQLNGVRLFTANSNSYVKRIPSYLHQNGLHARLNSTESIYGTSGNTNRVSGQVYHYNS